MKTKVIPPKPAQHTELVLITGAVAEQYLKGNVHNRALRQRVVDRYIAIIRGGNWETNHQGVCFDIEGTLSDGQHRLYAIWYVSVEDPEFAGVWMNVTFDSPVSAQATVDIGVTRTASDIMSLKRNQSISNSIVATARMMAGGLRGRKVGITNMPELDAFLDEHYEPLLFVDKLFANKSAKGVAAAGIKAVIGRAFYHLPHETLRRFANILITGLSVPGEEAAIMLRNHLKDGMSSYHKNSDSAAQLIYGRTERALEAFARNKALSKTPSPIKEELYPLPKEVTEAARIKREERDTARKARAKTLVSKLKAELEETAKTVQATLPAGKILEKIHPINPKGRKIKLVKGGGRLLATAAKR